MDSQSPKPDGQPDERVSALINEFFDRLQAGEQLSAEQFASDHPEATDDLRPYLDGLALIDQARSQAGEVSDALAAADDLPAVPGYELIEEIGRGGMGVVYKALQLSTKRVVALKVMLAGPFASHSAQRRFEREVELTARFQHPGIVRVLESGAVAGQRYYAMDYVSGTRLDRHVSTKETDTRAILDMFLLICDAIQYAHDHGVVHRDLKPSNILIDEEDSPHVLDFGLAKATDQHECEDGDATLVSLPGQVVGTLFYLSPEQAAAGTAETPVEIDARVDVYALGVMLFELLTGSLPYDTAGRPSQVIQRILEAPPVRPTSLSKRVDSELETIILKTLEKERQRRYASVRDMADDIRRYLAGEPIAARPPSSLYVFRKKLARHRAPVFAAGLTLIVVLAAVSAGVWGQRRDFARARSAVLGYQRALDDFGNAASAGMARATFQKHPELREARLVWAQVQYHGDAQQDAIRFLEGELSKNPSLWDCRALLAEIYARSGDAERAERLAERAARDFPGSAEDWYVRSFATLDLDDAMRSAARALELSPNHVLALRRLTHLQIRTDALDEALQNVNKLIELGGDKKEWEFTKANIVARQGRFREAIDLYTRVIASEPDQPRAYRPRAHVYRRLGEYELAVADYTTALKLDGQAATNVWDHYQRATPLWILGRVEEALDDYREVRIRLGRPFYSDARSYLILKQLGRDDQAEQILRDARREVRDEWLGQLFRMLAGELDGTELIAFAKDRGALEHLCEVYYYAGEIALLGNRLSEARALFEQCVQTGVEYDLETFPLTPMNEYELAQWRLKSLAGVPPGDDNAAP